MTSSKVAVAAIIIAICFGTAIRAEETYPSRPVTVVVPITAGTTIDIMARLYADKLARRFNQQVVVANRAGAGGMIGAQAVATSAPANL